MIVRDTGQTEMHLPFAKLIEAVREHLAAQLAHCLPRFGRTQVADGRQGPDEHAAANGAPTTSAQVVKAWTLARNWFRQLSRQAVRVGTARPASGTVG